MEAYRINPSRRDVLKSSAQKGLVTNYAHLRDAIDQGKIFQLLNIVHLC